MNLPLKEAFEINSTSKVGTVFRKWTCEACRRKSYLQLRKIKKEINMSMCEGTPCPVCLRTMSMKGTMRATPDHCHKTGGFRGVMCNDCNTAIGKLNDDVGALQRAIDHLKNFSTRKGV